jgi:hypothetical protein
MSTAYVTTGTLIDDRTVTLDERLPLATRRLRLVVAPLPSAGVRPYAEVVAGIRARQRDRGHLPPSRREVDGYLNAERDSWER